MKLIALLLAMAMLQSVDAQGPGGTVIDARTQAPIPFARVLFAKVDAPLAGAIVVETDAQGRFSTASVPAGTFRIIAEHDDHLRGSYGAPVAIAAGKADRISIALTPMVVLSGRVFNEHGAAAARVYVRAHRVSDNVVNAETVAESRTNDLGEYRLFGLAPGAYGISAEPYLAPSIGTVTLPGATTGANAPRYIVPTPPCPDCRGEGRGTQGLAGLLSSGAFIDPLALTGQSYPRVYFPGAVEIAQAKVVTAEPGARLEGLDIRLVLIDRNR
ncbi:MAG: carboxypeptidase regulatory-like domain-containing protein [Acidobacteria bacterium]|nr:carboxypeptidase regulatory-like domain-containing protein [Acidobacteriota bacterium]